MAGFNKTGKVNQENVNSKYGTRYYLNKVLRLALKKSGGLTFALRPKLYSSLTKFVYLLNILLTSCLYHHYNGQTIQWKLHRENKASCRFKTMTIKSLLCQCHFRVKVLGKY